jgi:hypothetical protein
VRRDLSSDVRRRGLEVRQGGRYEDLVLVSIPVGRVLSGAPPPPDGGAPPPPDEVRVRIGHLPPGVRLDVEFRGRVIPRPRED